MRNRPLKSGFTTGACAAAAAKAAAQALISVSKNLLAPTTIEIPFPDGSSHSFKIEKYNTGSDWASASVIKDAGDDPDVTNGAEITATVRLTDSGGIVIKGGQGVGLVTKPGLSVSVGEPAINPVPRKMILEAVQETSLLVDNAQKGIEIEVSIKDGELLAKKTLNYRLGIVGGLSVLGTTGIVKPLSTEAWTATIVSTMDVAKATGQREIVLSTGRTSENAHKQAFNLPDECYVMMGDYIEFAVREAERHGFEVVHLAAQWAKMLKIAMGIAHTHVRFGALDVREAIELLCNINQTVGGINPFKGRSFNTAREAFEVLQGSDLHTKEQFLFGLLSQVARQIGRLLKGAKINVHLVGYDNKVIASLPAPPPPSNRLTTGRHFRSHSLRYILSWFPALGSIFKTL